MSILDSLKGKVEVYVLQKGVAKGAKAAALFLVSFLASAKVQGALSHYGVHLEVDPVVVQAIVGAVLMKGGTMLLNFLKLQPKPQA